MIMNNAPISETGFESPLEAVLSGQYELCVPSAPIMNTSDPATYDWDRAFIRNGTFKVGDQWSSLISVRITKDEAEEIRAHKCVRKGLKGSLQHFHTGRFCVKPDHLVGVSNDL